MQKVYTLNKDNLMYDPPETDYAYSDDGSYIISHADKKKFLDDIAKWFRRCATDLLELQYQCEGCEIVHFYKEDIRKCVNCGIDICDSCCNANDDKLCENCNEIKEVEE